MGNGKSGENRDTGTGLFTVLTWLLWALMPWRENVRASPDIAKFPSHIRKAPEYTTILIYYRKLYTQYCTRIKNNHHFATQ